MEMMAAQRQMWIVEVRKVRVGLAALAKIRHELFIDREWRQSRAEADKIADEAMLLMGPEDVLEAAKKEAQG